MEREDTFDAEPLEAPAQPQILPQAQDQVHSASDHSDDPTADAQATLKELKWSLEFIQMLRNASLEKSGLDPEIIDLLTKEPPTSLPEWENDPTLRLSIEIFMALDTASQETYRKVCDAIERCIPGTKTLSYDAVRKHIGKITGIMPLINDMCLNSCAAYTGPFSKLEKCPYCDTSRWDQQVWTQSKGTKKVPVRQFYTILIGPQLQAIYRSVEGAEAMQYRKKLTEKLIAELQHPNNSNRVLEKYTDFFSGSEYLNAVREGKITEDDMVLVLSIGSISGLHMTWNQGYFTRKNGCSLVGSLADQITPKMWTHTL